MSIEMDEGADAILQAAREVSMDDLSEVEVDGDGSSSLSEIEENNDNKEDDGDGSEDLSNPSDEENEEEDEEHDSEAETERLEESPNKFRPHQDVVLSSRNNQSYEPSPSKLQNQINIDDLDDDDEEPLSDEDVSVNGFPGSPSFAHDENDAAPATGPTSLGDSTIENKTLLSAIESDTRKRKRSIFGSVAVDDDPDEPLRKRTGTIMTPGDNYAIEDDPNEDEEETNVSNPVSGNISGEEGGAIQDDDLPDEADELADDKDRPPEEIQAPPSPKRRGRKKKKILGNGVGANEDDQDAVQDTELALNRDEEGQAAEDDNAENEGDDEAEVALRNEEELEKKRIALDQLATIERQFATFRERLFTERFEQLNREEAMLRQDKPIHPDYLAMMQCIEVRRDDRTRVADKRLEYQLQTLKVSAVAKRAQVLTQYQQEVRELREQHLEKLGEQWYKIQHDRRSYAGSVPDYAIRFPTNRSQQVRNQVAYSNEVSILAGIAKYVGFPAAPRMAAATASELEEDMEKMGRTKHVHQSASLPLQELAALRAASASTRYKPAAAEEQFLEQTPWANPQHPSHAHLTQRQYSNHQIPRTSSPFSHAQAQRRHSHQQNPGPISGTFTNTGSSLIHHHSNGLTMSGGRVSPHNPFGNSNTAHTIAPSPLGSRQPSLSPQQARASPLPDQHVIQEVQKPNGMSRLSDLADMPRDISHDVRREQAAAVMTRL